MDLGTERINQTAVNSGTCHATMTPQDASSKWLVTSKSYMQTDGRYNNVYRMGWNYDVDDVAGPHVLTEPSFGMAFESHYAFSGAAWAEWYIEFTAPGTTTPTIRPFGVAINKATGTAQTSIQYDILTFRNRTGAGKGGVTQGDTFYWNGSGNYPSVFQWGNSDNPLYNWRWQVPGPNTPAARRGNLELIDGSRGVVGFAFSPANGEFILGSPAANVPCIRSNGPNVEVALCKGGPKTGLSAARLNLSDLPTSAAGLSPGDIYNDGGILKVA